ncbi:hypothetical protein PRUB_a4734 [Pseudoalteromonas rubra]|uniref:Uncharacterized protein n=1 Tax=Pseudoalteromonas rubra TaxID=43658 RepID=A0A8T0CC22_9GAMM|nr:leucine-rich repeat domain-containing protein [Pseudoalteromonas rubra]KAF7787602.1 hypothetical protein PRUB_a4734 [Pseudoalteromonas rubra]
MKFAMNARWRCLPLISAMAFTLAGCGGGSDKPSTSLDTQPDTQTNPKPTPTPTPTEPENQPPVVSINATGDQLERTAFTLTAEGSDTDGSVASYVWTHNAPLELTETATNTATPSYTVPDINQDITVTFTVTVSDDKGATSSASQEVLIKRKINSVTLTGVVTDKPIANAQVVVQAASAQAQVSASSEGQYTATLIVDESEADRPVVVTATGVDAQSQVEFVSVLHSVARLEQQAGEDGILDKSEHFGVNVTNVTTAEYALMTRTGTTIESDAQLEQALLNVDADEQLTLASLIKIVVDNDEYNLPEGVNTTLDLIDDEQTAQAFEDELNAADPQLIAQTRKSIKSDDDLIAAPHTSLEGDFIVQSVKYADLPPYHISLNEAGSGSVSAINTVEIDRWVQDQNTVTIALKQPLHVSTKWHRDYSVYPSTHSKHMVYVDVIKLTVLAENAVFRTVDIDELGQAVIEGDNAGTQVHQVSYTSNLIDKLKTVQVTPESLLGVWYLDLRDADEESQKSAPQRFEFKADGQVIALDDPDDELSWQLTDNTLTVSYREGDVTGSIAFWFTKKLDTGYQVVSLDLSVPQWPNTEFGLMIVAQPDLALTEETAAGRWHGLIGRTEQFDIDLFDTGKTHFNLSQDKSTWYIKDGELYRDYYSSTRWPQDEGCQSDEPDCILDARYKYQLVAVSGNERYVIQTFENYNSKGELFFTRANLFVYQYSDTIAQREFYQRNLERKQQLRVHDAEQGWQEVLFGTGITPQNADAPNQGEAGYQLSLQGVTYPVALRAGKLAFTKDEEAYFVDLLHYDPHKMVVCVYAAATGCHEADRQTWFFSPTMFTVAVSATGNGYVDPDSQQVIEGHSTGLNVIPDVGYMIDTIQGCNGWLDGRWYEIPEVTGSCEVTVAFVERPSLAKQVGITDPVLAQCVDELNVSSIEEVTVLDCSSHDEIRSVTGLANLTHLETLKLLNLSVTELDLSELTQLRVLKVFHGCNGLAQLTLSNPERIEELTLNYCGLTNAQITALELSRFTALRELDLSVNQLTELDISTLSQLESLSVSSNPLSQLTTGNHPQLTTLLISNNHLSTLDLTNMPELSVLDAWHNDFAQLDLAYNPQLRILDINGNPVEQLDLSANPQLQELDVGNLSQLTELDLSQQSQLIELDVGNNNHWQTLTLAPGVPLRYLNISSSPNLLDMIDKTTFNALVQLGINQIGAADLDAADIDLAQLSNLEALSWFNGEVEQLDLSELPQLKRFYLTGSSLTEISFSEQTQLTDLVLQGTKLTSLDLSAHPQLKYLDIVNTKITALDLSHTPSLHYLDVQQSAVTTVSGIESIYDKGATLDFTLNPLSDETMAYLANMQAQGYSNLRFGQVSRAQIKVTGNGQAGRLYVEMAEGQKFDLDLRPDPGHQLGSATGCPGELLDTVYRLGPLRGDCVLEVEFVPQP